MKVLDIIFEAAKKGNPSSLKDVLAGKIQQLPDDENTAKALKEIEDLLNSVSAGGRWEWINRELVEIKDDAVNKTRKLLATYVYAMQVDPVDRKEMFDLWQNDQLVNVGLLLSKSNQTFDKIFTKYGVNPAITELVDTVMQVAELGQGKGEFGLNVLSRSITVAKRDPAEVKKTKKTKDEDDGSKKGDLLISLDDGSGTAQKLKVEVKTLDKGGARFSDQEVRPAEHYEASAIAINNFVKNQSAKLKLSNPVVGYGLSLGAAIEFYQQIPPAEQSEFEGLLDNVITKIFGDKQSKSNQDGVPAHTVSNIIEAIKSGNFNVAKQAYAKASFNYYISKKDDDGVLNINLNTKEFVFYSVAEDLDNVDLRLNAGTIYLSTVKDPGRGVYPQMSVVGTTRGADALTGGISKLQKTAKKKTLTDDDINQLWQDSYAHALNLASTRGFNDQKTVDKIHQALYNTVTQQFNLDKTELSQLVLKSAPEVKKKPVSQ
jgi:hypothetical protein